MRFDMTDPERLTRRTDIAFWLHCLQRHTTMIAQRSRKVTIENTPLDQRL